METYREFRPARRLARYVECYWSWDDSEGTSGYRVLPDGCVDILLSSRNGKPCSLEIVGLMTTTKTLDIPAGQSFFGVRFHPGMAASFLPEAARLNDKIEPLENVISRPARVILEELRKAAGPLEMVAALEEFLRPLDPSDAAEKGLQYMAHIQGPLDNLAADAGLSTRHLRRICLDRAGVSPKYLARILRFRRAAERMAAMTRRSAQPKWADFAVACGYYDQAHFIREFQEFTGSTPGRYLQSLTQRLPYNSVA